MSTAKHAPGPWAYRPLDFDDWGWVRAAPDAEGFEPLVACARSGTQDGEDLDAHRRNGTDPWEANARLIAAAPDYDAAARMLLAGLPDETFQYRETLTKSEVEHLNAAIHMFKAARAKAEGRS